MDEDEIRKLALLKSTHRKVGSTSNTSVGQGIQRVRMVNSLRFSSRLGRDNLLVSVSGSDVEEKSKK